MQLTKINHIGYSYFHRFKMNDGSIKEVETTKEDYLQLGSSSPINPKITGGRWLFSYECLRFYTPTGKIDDNQWADIEGRYAFIKLPNKRETSIPLKEIKNSDVTIKGLELIESNTIK